VDKSLYIVDKQVKSDTEPGVEEAVEIRQLLLIRKRYEQVDDYLELIDKHLRELAERGSLSIDILIAINEARAAIIAERTHPRS
jgi:hypothetical protein